MKITTAILGFVLTVGFLLTISAIQAAHHEQGHDHAEHHQHSAKKSDKVRCAISGMMMKATAMVEMTHNGKTYYFCNAKQAQMFKAHPDKYLKQISLGPITFNLNLLTVKEYKEMMQDMGMGGMMKMDALKGKTHRLSVYTTTHHHDLPLEGTSFALQITDAKGKATTVPLTYNKMMKTHDAFVAVPAGGMRQIRVLITTPSTNVSL